mmetsp:Transcript_4087/g.13781  ORF Transcript_4087/g.13781 Transcript_4087/m.13781 type:complete len:303 (+) Transcript_4087:36-944(+)
MCALIAPRRAGTRNRVLSERPAWLTLVHPGPHCSRTASCSGPSPNDRCERNRRPASTAPLPPPPPAAAAPKDGDGFDCEVGVEDWRASWSSEKADWCCDNKDKGCSFDCLNGYAMSETDWSEEKSGWCCEHTRLGCSNLMPDAATTAAAANGGALGSSSGYADGPTSIEGAPGASADASTVEYAASFVHASGSNGGGASAQAEGEAEAEAEAAAASAASAGHPGGGGRSSEGPSSERGYVVATPSSPRLSQVYGVDSAASQGPPRERYHALGEVADASFQDGGESRIVAEFAGDARTESPDG